MRKILFLVAFTFLFIGCNDTNEEVKFIAKSNAYIRVKNDGTTKKYGYVLTVSTNEQVKSVVASNTAGENFQLKPYWGHTTEFRWIPEEEEYATKSLKNETFTFKTISNKGEEITATESSNASDIPADMQITKLNYDADKGEIVVEWTNNRADAYAIKILSTKMDDAPIFQSPTLQVANREDANLNFTINREQVKWYHTNPTVIGKEYIVSVHAFKFRGAERKSVGGEYIAYKIIKWGTSSSN